jgi:hypothetical protein
VRQNHANDAAGAQIEEGGIAAEERGVAELEKRAEDGGRDRGVWVRDAEFVEVMNMCEAED